ncbi:MAG TPA: tRNA pseudouridine(13) synthase TruD [Methanomassiliicoccales archaeon]|nr:tRNA pseudouridine(13) synthase TruD [Methanomassiliicoccales archaeon]
MVRPSAQREREIGLEVFYTDTPGTGGKLKACPEDFVVEEVSKYPPEKTDGRYCVARVTATNWETNRLVRHMAKALGISRNGIGFAGTKDKRAVTTQLMSFEAPVERVMALRIPQVRVEGGYMARRGMALGDLVGNTFKIYVRDTELRGSELRSSLEGTQEALRELGGFPNFFGVQRFGAVRPVTHLVGRAIVKGDMERAVLLYIGNPSEDEEGPSREAREALERDRDYSAALRTFPRTLTFERMVIGYLERNPEDYAGAIRVLPPNLQMMFVHAYQSYLFNVILSERMRRGIPLNAPIVGDVVLPADRDGNPDHDKPVPVTTANLDLVEEQVRERRAFVSATLFGYGSELAEGEMGEIERRAIEREGLSPRDFLVPQVPHCSSKGSRRELVCEYRDLRLEVGEDGYVATFFLGKGCYATVLLRELMKADVCAY